MRTLVLTALKMLVGIMAWRLGFRSINCCHIWWMYIMYLSDKVSSAP